MYPKINSIAPEINLPDQFGELHSLKEFFGSWVLLYFYPKDDTPGCTTEACALRDYFSDYEKNKIKILGVSVDDVTSHKKFVDKLKLPFLLLADQEKKVVNSYDVWQAKKFMGRTYQGIVRVSFLIGPDGKIKKIYEKVKPAEHAAEVLADVASMK